MAKKKEKLSLEELLEQALIKEEDRPYEVPGNWVWVDCCRVFDIVYGKNLPTKCLTETGYPVFGANGHIGFYSQYIYEKERALMSCRGAYSGAMNISLPYSYITNNSLVLTPRVNNVTSEFIAYLFEALDKTNLISGSAQPQVTVQAFAGYPIPLMPIAEQQRIVDIIEQIFKKLDTAKEMVQNALDSFENRKAAILHKAFTGKLTAKWREVNDLTPVKSILKDIEEERYNLQKKHSINKNFSYKKSVQIEIQGRTKGIDKLFELPNTWDWVSLGQVTWNVSDGPHFSPNYVGKEVGVPIISARNVKYKNIDFSDAKYVSNEDYHEFIKRGKPEIGDVILTKGGTTGIPTTVDTDKEFCIWVHIALLKIIKKYASPEYIRDVLASTILYRQSQEQTHGVGNQDLGLTRMIYMALPLPPVDEQKEIVRILDNLLDNEQRAKELCDVIEKIDLMKKAILSRAFRGELGTNDPEEESAVELLKEVLKEKI